MSSVSTFGATLMNRFIVQIENPDLRMCLDNDEYLFQAPNPLTIKPCTHSLPAQVSQGINGRVPEVYLLSHLTDDWRCAIFVKP